MRNREWYIFATVLIGFISGFNISYADAGAKIYYVRHAETMGNVTRNYTDENQRIFSEYGKSQVAGIAEKLGQYEFDYIAVSPTWRTRQTVLPYLMANDRVGLIWPEIEEGGCDLRGGVKPADELVDGDAIEILPENSNWLALRDRDTTHRFEQRNDEESLAVYLRGVELLKKQFGGTGKRVLLVSHSCTGSRLFELLLGVEPRGRFSPKNASVTLLEEGENGVFSLVQFNDSPFRQFYSRELSLSLDSNENLQVSLSFLAEYFGEASTNMYCIDWSFRGIEGTDYIKKGRCEFLLSTNTERNIKDIEITLDDIPLGAKCIMDLKLSCGEKLLKEWTEEVKVPVHYDLSGEWLIQAGDDAGWMEPALADSEWKTTAVPGSWEDDALPDYDGIAWYRYHFSIPDAWLNAWGDKPLAIAFGGVDDADYTYLNGTLIGQSGRFPPDEKTAFRKKRVYAFERSLLKDADNVLAVRVSDWLGAGGIWKTPVAVGPVDSFEKP